MLATGWRALQVVILAGALSTWPPPERVMGQPNTSQSTFDIRVRTDLIELFMVVRDGRNFVGGLAAEDFRVVDEGKEVALAFLETEEYPVKVCLLLDVSGSMQQAISQLQAGAIHFVSRLRDQDEVSIFSLGGGIKQLTPFTTDKLELARIVGGIYADGYTPLYDAVIHGITTLERERGRRAIVLFTDGADNASRLSRESVARRCGRSSIPLFFIASGDALDNQSIRRALDALAKSTGGEALFIRQFSELERAFEKIALNLRSAYHAGYYYPGELEGKWHRVEVELKRRKGKVVTRAGYFANP